MAASTVFICDPWWNGAIEDQCIARSRRIGQKANVIRVVRFIVEDSVEVGISKIQENKRKLSKAVTNDFNRDNANENDRDNGGKLTIDDFKLLFSSIRARKPK